MSNVRMKRVDLGGCEHMRAPGRKKLGRNNPCFCGSGRKFKHCHFNQLRTIAGR